MKYKMNKRGVATMVIILGVLAALFFLLGFGTTFKIASILKSIPKPMWYLLGFIIILMLLPKRK